MTAGFPSANAIQAYQKAILLLKANQLSDAAEALRLLLKENPKWIEPLLSLAELALCNESHIQDPELNSLLNALRDPRLQSDHRALFLRARHAEMMGDRKQAIGFLQQSLEQQKNFHAAAQQLALLHLQQENWSTAETLLREQVQKHPRQPHLLINLAVALLRQNRLKEALPVAGLVE